MKIDSTEELEQYVAECLFIVKGGNKASDLLKEGCTRHMPIMYEHLKDTLKKISSKKFITDEDMPSFKDFSTAYKLYSNNKPLPVDVCNSLDLIDDLGYTEGKRIRDFRSYVFATTYSDGKNKIDSYMRSYKYCDALENMLSYFEDIEKGVYAISIDTNEEIYMPLDIYASRLVHSIGDYNTLHVQLVIDDIPESEYKRVAHVYALYAGIVAKLLSKDDKKYSCVYTTHVCTGEHMSWEDIIEEDFKTKIKVPDIRSLEELSKLSVKDFFL